MAVSKLKILLLSLLVPIGVLTFGVISRLLVTYSGFIAVIIIFLITVIHAAFRLKTVQSKGLLKLAFTFLFLFITGFSFANRRTVMGFDIMQMGVPVMQPAVPQGARFLLDTWAYHHKRPERGDIVAHSFDGQQGIYLNRIIAIANDRICIKDGVVYLNGQPLKEPYVLHENVTKWESKEMREIIVPEGHYFVMGDNRDRSFGDSRFSGVIALFNIKGKKTDLLKAFLTEK